jgi:hypothetical protein
MTLEIFYTKLRNQTSLKQRKNQMADGIESPLALDPLALWKGSGRKQDGTCSVNVLEFLPLLSIIASRLISILI